MAASSAVRRVVITGGPCSGKTSVMPILQSKLAELGWKVRHEALGASHGEALPINATSRSTVSLRCQQSCKQEGQCIRGQMQERS